MAETLSDLVNLRLEVADKLVGAVCVEKDIIKCSGYQATTINSLTSDSSDFEPDKTLPKCNVQVERLDSFVLNEQLIKKNKDKKCLILDSLSGYPEMERLDIESRYLASDIPSLLEKCHQMIEDVKQMTNIRQTQEIRLKTASLETRIRALILDSDSRVLASKASLIYSASKLESMKSCRTVLEHLQEMVQQLKCHELRPGCEDPDSINTGSTFHRLAQIRSGLVRLHDMHSKYTMDIAIAEEDAEDLMMDSVLPMAKFHEEIDPHAIETKIKILMVNFFEADKINILQRLGLNPSVNIEDLMSDIWTRLEKVISNLNMDDDNRETLYAIWNTSTVPP